MSLKSRVKNLTRALGLDLRRLVPEFNDRCISLEPPGGASRGNVLLAYILDPFLVAPGTPISSAHTHHQESVLIAQAFINRGFSVDVIDYKNHEFRPEKKYDVFVSARTHFDSMARQLPSTCIKIAHLDTAHFLFNNAAAYHRALNLQRRRGVTSVSIRVVEHNRAIECCDFAAVLGGGFCMSTYAFAKKPMFRLPVPTNRTYPLDPQKDYNGCRDRFLWFGSTGLVHKGLDLVLDAFTEMPDLNLTVGGRLDQETEFRSLYHKELHETSNINAAGWIDVESTAFIELANRTLAVVFPSCSESESCSVLTCMQAGLIPVVTAEAGIDVQDFGIVIEDASVGAVRKAVETLIGLPAADLKEMSQKAWQYTRTRHSAEAYTRAYNAMLDEILRLQTRS